jgi:hypothetical protein
MDKATNSAYILSTTIPPSCKKIGATRYFLTNLYKEMGDLEMRVEESEEENPNNE